MHRIRLVLKHRSLGISCLFAGSTAAFLIRPTNVQLEKKKEADTDTGEDGKEEYVPFDLTKEWAVQQRGPDFLRKFIFTNETNLELGSPEKQQKEDSSPIDCLMGWAASTFVAPTRPDNDDKNCDTGESFLSAVLAFARLLVGTDESKSKAIQNLIQMARLSSANDQDDSEDIQSYQQILEIIRQDLDAVSKSLTGSIGHIDLSQLFPTSLFYFLEVQDEKKNPSWKRRMHRFCPGINSDEVNYLNDALYLAEIAYHKSAEAIKTELDALHDPMELVYSSTEGKPRQPAHFIALKKNQSVWSSVLEVVIVVRGTSSVTDAITDCICEAVDYRGGKAHSGILDSGMYLVEKHMPLLKSLKKMSGKRKLKITLIGHSLGAGTAAIAGMEFNAKANVEVKVIGFGCPALLSEDLSKSVSSYMTTVVNDADLVPRLSGASIANLLLDIQEYNYVPSSRRDIVQAFEELQRVSPGIFSQDLVNRMMGNVDAVFESCVIPSIKPATDERSEPVLFPPGRCVHFYHDGHGITGAVTPCTFFREIDLTRRMVDDHLITPGYRQTFLDLMRQYHHDQKISFDETDTRKNGGH